MNTIQTCFMLLIIFLQQNHINCSKTILITLERAEIICDEDVATNCSCKVGKFNRTSDYLLDMYVTLVKPFDKNFTVTFKTYQLKNNQYKETFIGFKMNACAFIEREKWIQAMVKGYGRIPDKCPVEEGLYYLKDFRVAQGTLPLGLSISKWKFSYIFESGVTNLSLFNLSIYFKVDQHLERRKKN